MTSLNKHSDRDRDFLYSVRHEPVSTFCNLDRFLRVFLINDDYLKLLSDYRLIEVENQNSKKTAPLKQKIFEKNRRINHSYTIIMRDQQNTFYNILYLCLFY